MLMVPTRILPMVTTRLLGWPTKIRMGLECLRRPSGAAREDRSVADFIREHYGQEAVDYLAEPLLAGVYGGDPELLSVSSVLAMFTELERKYGSLSRGVLAARRRSEHGRQEDTSVPDAQGRARLSDGGSGRGGVTPHDVVRGHGRGSRAEDSGFPVRLPGGPIQAGCVVLACQAYEAGGLLRSSMPNWPSCWSRFPTTLRSRWRSATTGALSTEPRTASDS